MVSSAEALSKGTPRIQSGQYLTFTDNVNGTGLQSRYHVYADNIDWTQNVGVVYYLDGDYFSTTASTFHKPNGVTLKNMAQDANNKNLVLIVPETPSGKTAANGWTWWENGNTNAQWFDAFAKAMKNKAGFNPSDTWTVGYSGGAEFLTMNVFNQNRSVIRSH